MRLDGRIAIVTGAASGIGLAITEVFVREGAKVLAADLPGSTVMTRFASQPQVVPFAADVTAERAPADIVAAAVEAFGGIDILVNNAGYNRYHPVEEFPIEEFDALLAVHLRAPFRICKAAIPHLKKSGRGRIINMASIAAIHSSPGIGAYSAAKAGLASLTRTLALELGPDGVTANCIMPGSTYTALTKERLDDAVRREAAVVRTALGRVGEADDIADTALFLASDEARYITGQGIVVDGGVTVRL